MTGQTTDRAVPTPLSETAVLTVLTSSVALVGAVMVGLHKASVLEGISFVTGAICVWFTVKENIWNFPLGLLNTATFSLVFFRARLFGDATLQIVYFVLNAIGWYMWLYGGDRHTRLRVDRAGAVEKAAVGAAMVVSTLVLWKTLRLVGGSSSFWDALTTSVSLGAQWLLNRKKLENWHLWILVDIVYVPLYVARGLALTAMLYVVFTVMAVMGLMHWRAAYSAARSGVETV